MICARERVRETEQHLCHITLPVDDATDCQMKLVTLGFWSFCRTCLCLPPAMLISLLSHGRLQSEVISLVFGFRHGPSKSLGITFSHEPKHLQVSDYTCAIDRTHSVGYGHGSLNRNHDSGY